MPILSQRRVAILAADGFEEVELSEPMRVLREEGAKVEIIAPHGGTILSKSHGEETTEIEVDRVLSATVLPDEYDALLLPGGRMNVKELRNNALARRFVKAMEDAEKPIAAICHAAWILAAADAVSGRSLTSFPSIRADLEEAGAQWLNQEVVVDNNLVTSREPADLPAFIVAMMSLFSRKEAMISPETRHLFARSRFA